MTEGPRTPRPGRPEVGSVLLILTILTSVQWHLVVLIHDSLVPRVYLLLYIFCEVSVQIFYPLFNWVRFLLLNFNSSL